MAVKVFLDANVLVDFALERELFDSANAVMNLVTGPGFAGYISTSVLHITGYWIAKDNGNKNAKEFLLLLLNDIRVIDIPHEIAVAALLSNFNDIEDALQYYTAIHYKLDYFISNDKKLKKDGTLVLPVLTPKEFLEEFA
jgi:predicted nucleic acid-binding protein